MRKTIGMQAREGLLSLVSNQPTNRFGDANDSDMTAVERRNKIEGGDET